MTGKFPRPALVPVAVAVLAAAVLTGCGNDDRTTGTDQPDAGLTAVRSYLIEHSADLVARTDSLRTAGNAYYDLAKANDFDYRKMLKKDGDAVNTALTEAKNAFVKANPAYEEMEGIVAGIPRTSQYDTDIDNGSDASGPGSAVSFNLTLPDGEVMKQPGNLFSLIETSLYGTNDALAARGVKPDVNGDGKVEFGEGLPEANVFKAAVDQINKQARDLEKDAREIVVTPSDVFTAITVIAPNMGEYFEQWKRSSFVAGEDRQEEESFVATSRLSDIADILTGLEFAYGEIEPLISEENPAQAEQIASEMSGLLTAAEELRDREAAGEKFTVARAGQIGADMQARAERIASQVAQAARDLDIEIQEN